jgi:DsbC/DsbD-like thiol-disulfide interchange protein
MTASKAYKAGQPGSVTAVVNALGEYHVNPEYPYKVKLGAAPAGVTFPEDTVRDVSRSEKRATMTIPFTPSQAGSATISGTISLSVCSKDQCVIEKAPVSVTVKVD